MQEYPYYYLSQLNETEFKIILDLMNEYGLKGFVGIASELARFGKNKSMAPGVKADAEMLHHELESLIERMNEYAK